MIIVVDDPDEFFEHFGVKGMQWGVRRQERRIEKSNHLTEKIEKLTDKRDKIETKITKVDNRSPNHGRNTALKVAAGTAAVGVGALFVHKYLKSNGRATVKSISNGVSRSNKNYKTITAASRSLSF